MTETYSYNIGKGESTNIHVRAEEKFLAQVALRAPPEVALRCVAGHCYYLLSVFPFLSVSFFLFRLLLLTHFGESPV